jgi:hypothetical protein
MRVSNLWMILDFTGSLCATCLQKYIALPWRKFLNSNRWIPAGTSTDQPANLPFPFPIREPSTFRLKGMCGNTLNHKYRNVLSNFRDDFFKKILYRKTCLLFKHRGCSNSRPMFPKIKRVNFVNLNERLLKIFLWVNLRGLNNNYTLRV